MRNYFPKQPSGAPLHTLSKLYDVPLVLMPPPVKCIALYAVTEGCLLIDIGWFVLFFTHMLLMVRGGTLWILGHKVKDQGLLRRTNLLNRVVMLQSTICSQSFEISCLSCEQWEEDPLTFDFGSRCQCQLRYFVCENFWARYKLVLCNYFQIPHISC